LWITFTANYCFVSFAVGTAIETLPFDVLSTTPLRRPWLVIVRLRTGEKLFFGNWAFCSGYDCSYFTGVLLSFRLTDILLATSRVLRERLATWRWLR
jgi:hypothetical protein